jgi:hypothetical protein
VSPGSSGGGVRPNRGGSSLAGHSRPFADVPAPDEPVDHIRVDPSEGFRNIRGLAPEQKDSPVDRIGQGSRQLQFTSRVRRPRLLQVCVAVLGATLNIVRADLVKEQKVFHRRVLLTFEFKFGNRVQRLPIA